MNFFAFSILLLPCFVHAQSPSQHGPIEAHEYYNLYQQIDEACGWNGGGSIKFFDKQSFSYEAAVEAAKNENEYHKGCPFFYSANSDEAREHALFELLDSENTFAECIKDELNSDEELSLRTLIVNPKNVAIISTRYDNRDEDWDSASCWFEAYDIYTEDGLHIRMVQANTD